MVRFAKPHVSVIYTDLWRNMIMLISYDFYIKNLTVRFTIPVISVIFKNSAAVTITQPGCNISTSSQIQIEGSKYTSFSYERVEGIKLNTVSYIRIEVHI